MDTSYEVLTLLKEVSHAFKKQMFKQFEKYDLSGSEIMAVTMVIHSGDMKISELSERMNLSMSTVSGIVDRLEKSGVFERRKDVKDRRVVRVGITKEYKVISKKDFNAFEIGIKKALSHISDTEYQQIIQSLKLLNTIITDLTDQDNEGVEHAENC